MNDNKNNTGFTRWRGFIIVLKSVISIKIKDENYRSRADLPSKGWQAMSIFSKGFVILSSKKIVLDLANFISN